MSIQQTSLQPSAMPTGSAQPAAPQPQWTGSVNSAAPAPQAVAPQVPQGQPVPQAPQASWGSDNPWLQGFSQPVPSSMPTYPSQGWAAPSHSTPTGLSQAQVGNWAPLSAAQQVSAPSAPAPALYPVAPISSPQPTPASPSLQEIQQQAYSKGRADQAAVARAEAAQRPAASADRYLSGISDQSLEILQAFGPEAPAKLNLYAVRLEDVLVQSFNHQKAQAHALKEQGGWIRKAQQVLKAAHGERQGLLEILTNPDRLADYTARFFGPGGPAPTLTPGEQARAALEQGLVKADGPLMPYQRRDEVAAGLQQARPAQQQQQQPPAPQGFSRPQMSMPTPGGTNRVSPQSVWSQFSQLMDVDPSRAYMVLDYAQSDPAILRSKVLVMDS